MKSRAWTEKQNQFLWDNYAKLSPKEMAPIIGKTIPLIRTQLRTLGIIKAGISVVCRFCNTSFKGKRIDLRRGACKSVECLERNRLEKSLVLGRRNEWSAQKKWNKDNKDKLLVRNRVSNLTPEQHKQRQKLWRDSYWRDPEKARKRISKITSTPEYKKASRQRHNAKYYLIGYHQVNQYAKSNGLSTKEAREILYSHFQDKMICSICNRIANQIPDLGSMGRRGFHVDHIDGNRNNNHLGNLQILCWKCNTCKLDMPMIEGAKELIEQLTNIYYNNKKEHPNV